MFESTNPADIDRLEYLLQKRLEGEQFARARLWSKRGVGTCGVRYCEKYVLYITVCVGDPAPFGAPL